MKVKVYTLNSFVKCIEGGNPAGVVLNADALSEDHMEKVASIVGFSETTFVIKSDLADFKGYFLHLMKRLSHPNNVGRCGHICNAGYAEKRYG